MKVINHQNSKDTYYKKKKISQKLILLFQRSKNWRIKKTIENKESSHPYERESIKFVDNINFDNDDFDDNVIDYVEECIQSCHLLNFKKASYLSESSLKW